MDKPQAPEGRARPACVLALDLGSTSFKAALYDRALRRMRQASVELEYRRGRGGEVELEVPVVGRAIRALLEGVLGDAGVRSGRAPLAAIAITSQAQTFTLLDAGGEPLLPFVSWMDSRAAAESAHIASLAAFQEFGLHVSFGSPIAGLTLCVLAHLHAASPELLRRSSRLVFLPMHVLRVLCGEQVVDDNLAAMTGLYSLADGGWWEAALRHCGLGTEALPRVVRVGSVASVTASCAPAWGVPSGVPVILAGNDQTAGAFGCAIHETEELLITLGTAQVAYLSCASLPAPDPALFRGPYPGSRAYRAAADNGGGSLVGWACRLLGDMPPDELFRLAARAPAGCEGLRLLGSPLDRSGRWEGLSTAHGPAHLARSVVEHLVEGMRAMVGRLQAGAPPRTRALVSGGGSRQAFWIRLLEESLQMALRPVDADPLLGAARMALEAVAQGR